MVKWHVVYGSYSGLERSDNSKPFCPSHLAVDTDTGIVFVADHTNNRVICLSPLFEHLFGSVHAMAAIFPKYYRLPLCRPVVW